MTLPCFKFARAALLGLSLSFSAVATAGVTYSLVENQAQAGEPITIRALVFNDEANALSWTPPESLVLQWHQADQSVMRSLAKLKEPAQELSVPVNHFTMVE